MDNLILNGIDSKTFWGIETGLLTPEDGEI